MWTELLAATRTELLSKSVSMDRPCDTKELKSMCTAAFLEFKHSGNSRVYKLQAQN